jgi:arginine/lysine/histidine transport system ATP-binding protein
MAVNKVKEVAQPIADRPAIITVANLKKQFGSNRVLRDVDVEIHKGEVVVVIGTSGSGKSTFLRCLNLLETPTGGRIVIDGVETTAPKVDLNALRQKVGMVFQSFNLFPNLSVLDNIKLAPRKLRKLSNRAATRLAKKLLADVGLADKTNAFPSQLSGGQKQHVDLEQTSHGVEEVAECGFVNPKTTRILPSYLTEVDLNWLVNESTDVQMMSEL